MALNEKINKTIFTDRTNIEQSGKQYTKAIHIQELQKALEKLNSMVVNVDNCGNCVKCETCQSCQKCQTCACCQCGGASTCQ